MRFIQILLQLLVLIFIASACTPPTEPDPATAPLQTVIPSTTKLVTPEEAEQGILIIDEDGALTLAEDSELADGIEVGDVIVHQGSMISPDGFLRKIEAIRQEGNNMILETRQAALTEAIQSCAIRDSMQITKAKIDSVWVADGVTYDPDKGISTEFNFDLDMVLLDADGSDDTDMDRITVTGNVSFGATIHLLAEIDDWELQEFECSIERNMILNTSLTVGAGYQWAPVQKKLATLFTSNYIIFVGFMPITFQPKIDLILKCTVEGSVQIVFGYSLEETTRNGSRYAGGQWTNINEANQHTEAHTPEVVGQIQAKLSLGTKNQVMIYGLLGPYIEGMAFLQATAAAEASPQGVNLSAMLEAGSTAALGFHMEILSHTFFDFNAEWEIYRILIWQDNWYMGYSGTIIIEALPEELLAPWILQFPSQQWDGNGSTVLEYMPAGPYIFEWQHVEGWIVPQIDQHQFQLADDETMVISGLYIEEGPGTIFGEVRDAVNFTLIQGASISYWTMDGGLISEAITDEQGQYQFQEVQAGTYEVIAEAEGYVTNTAANLQVVDVEGNLERADFALPPLSSSHRFGAFSGRVFDSYGQPLAGAGVALSGGNQTNGIFRSTTTDADGTYSITAIVLDDATNNPIEEFTVIVSAQNYLTTWMTLDLIQNETLTNVDFYLEPWDPSAIIFSDGCETSEGWILTGFWNLSSLNGINNSACPYYVYLAPNDNSGGDLPEPAEGQHAFWYGQPTAGNFLGTQASNDSQGSGGTSTAPNSGELRSPAFTIPFDAGSVLLTFDTWFEIESVNPNASGFDIMSVSVLNVATGQLTELGRLNPIVDPTLPNRHAIPFTSGGFNVAPVWRQAESDLSSFTGKTIRLVFQFNTVDRLYNGFRGWIVDNIMVSQSTPKGAPRNTLQLHEGTTIQRSRQQ